MGNVIKIDMKIEIIRGPISKEKLKESAKEMFGDFVKAVVDIEKSIMAIGGELHADEERVLLEDGSRQKDVWGINLWIEKDADDWIEFNSMINVRPSQGNRTRGIDDNDIKIKIRAIVKQLVLP